MEKKVYKKKLKPENPLQAAWKAWAGSLSSEERTILNEAASTPDCQALVFRFPYHQYANLLVVNRKAFSEGLLKIVTEICQLRDQQGLWSAVANSLGVDHIGVTAPIPLNVAQEVGAERENSAASAPAETSLDNGTNTLRSPTAFQPLHGDFGPAEVRSVPCTTESADKVFWAKALQHGVVQMWSPLHTMFSAGNIKEKERVLHFGRADTPSSAVDLYAGIGYFAFCYRKRAADVVLCWEINSWSIEGFRRGALANRWAKQLHIVPEGHTFQPPKDWNVDKDTTCNGGESLIEGGLVMFSESNVNSLSRIRGLRASIPPVRHVNCGFLPTSEPVWEQAVQIIDPVLGGVVHAHENVAVKDIETRTAEVVQLFQSFANRHFEDQSSAVKVECTRVAQVKTYAPGVMHCVLDIQVTPSRSLNSV